MRGILLVLLLFAALPGFSQILNVEKNRLRRDTTHYWIGEVNFNLLLHNRTATTENPVRFTGIGSGADVAYVNSLHRYMLMNQLNYTAVTGNAFVSTGYSHFRTNFYWRNTISYEVFTQYQYDLGRGLKNRFLSGGTLRYTFVEEEKIQLAFGLGAMYEHERWEVPRTNTPQFINTDFIKSTNYLSARWQINEFVAINSIVYFQTTYDKAISGFRNRFSTDSNLNVKLTSKLSFFATFNAQYDGRPVVLIVPFVYSLNNGLKMAF